MIETGLTFSTTTNQKSVDLSTIHQGMMEEGAMLHPKISELHQSYNEDMAMVMNYEGEPAGFMRFEWLLTSTLRQRLEMDSLPLIWELGSVIVLPEFRGRGLAKPFHNAFLEHQNGKITSGEVLVIGTTKEPKVLSFLQDAKEVGVPFYALNHNDSPMVASFTCICKGEFGNGYHITSNCPERISPIYSEYLNNRLIIPLLSEVSPRCTMFASNREVVERVEDQLVARFGNQRLLVEELRNLNYYPT